MDAVILNDDGSTSRLSFAPGTSAEDIKDKLDGHLTEAEIEKLPNLNDRIREFANLYERRNQAR